MMLSKICKYETNKSKDIRGKETDAMLASNAVDPTSLCFRTVGDTDHCKICVKVVRFVFRLAGLGSHLHHGI